jgi:microcystin-dependent protein
MPLWSWSRLSANANGSSDVGINFLENQAPSSLNDSCRAMMQATAQYRDDVAGATVTSGAPQAYNLSTFSNFTSAAAAANQLVAFTPHVSNGAGPVTISVDSIANAPLRTSPNTELLAGMLIAGTPYCCVFNQTDGAFYLQGLYGNPYNVPLGAGMDYWGVTAPNSSFAIPAGQQLSITTYAKLYALFGPNRFGADTSSLFFLPDKTGRVSAMIESASSRLTSTFFGGNSTIIGAVGGSQSHLLTVAEMPAHRHAVFLAESPHTHGVTGGVFGGVSTTNLSPSGVSAPFNASAITITPAVTGITISDGSGTPNATAGVGGSTAHPTVTPTICCNYVMRVL